VIHAPPPVLKRWQCRSRHVERGRAGALPEHVPLVTMHTAFNEMNCAAGSVMRSPLTQLMES
jgi:hypothetical protein